MSEHSSTTAGFQVNGCFIPAVGLGTFQSEQGNDLVKEAVAKAIKVGYRHFDTAAAYGNEKDVGQAIEESGVPREEFFITTKLGQTWHDPGDVEEALDKSLSALNTSYVDLFLIHFPHAYTVGPEHGTLHHPNGKPVIDHTLSAAYPKTWQAMKQLVRSGKVKLLGVSNFNQIKLKRLLETCTIRPSVNQVEIHPYLPQHELLEFCSRENIYITAHQPLGGRPVAAVSPDKDKPGLLHDPVIAKIAASYNISAAQVLLSWAVQRGVSVVPKTVQESRMIENRNLTKLGEADMKTINELSLSAGSVRYLNPRHHIGFDIFDEAVGQPEVSG